MTPPQPATRDRVVASSPAWVVAGLGGPVREVPVVHRGADAVYVDLGDRVLGVLSTAATAVPCGLRTTLPVLPVSLTSARRALVGGGHLDLDDTRVVVTRVVDAGVPRRPGRDPDTARHLLARALASPDPVDPTAAPVLRAVVDELPPEALVLLADGDPDAAALLLGRGSGLTPVGDDVLCGALATLVSAAVRAPALTAAVLTLAPERTTALSATLLGCAARGDVLPQFAALLQHLGAPGTADPDDHDDPRTTTAATALVRVGHTSGAGLLLGTALALRHLATRSTLR